MANLRIEALIDSIKSIESAKVRESFLKLLELELNKGRPAKVKLTDPLGGNLNRLYHAS